MRTDESDTPAAKVADGALCSQRVVNRTVGTMAELVTAAEISPPTVSTFGQVADLAVVLERQRGVRTRWVTWQRADGRVRQSAPPC